MLRVCCDIVVVVGICVHMFYMLSTFKAYLAHIGWLGRSSARLESWWPRTRTSPGRFPRCSQSAMLLQDRWQWRDKEDVWLSSQNICLALCPLSFSSGDSLSVFIYSFCACVILRLNGIHYDLE